MKNQWRENCFPFVGIIIWMEKRDEFCGEIHVWKFFPFRFFFSFGETRNKFDR